MNRIEYAKKLADAGFRIFLCKPNSKEPKKKYWKEEDSQRTVRELVRNPALNFGVQCGTPLDGGYPVVLDLDVKNGKDGVARLNELVADAGATLPDTFTVETPNGGKHLYFTAAKLPSRSGSHALGKDSGIDVQSEGRYVVGPGSVFEGKAYTVSSDTDTGIAPLPECIADKLAGGSVPEVNATKAEDMIVPSGIERATHYLINEAPAAIAFQGGNEATYVVACKVKGFGVSQSDALALMAEHYNPRCVPPWAPDELRDTVANAYEYSKEPIGSAAPEAVFDAVIPAPAEEKPVAPSRLRVKRRHEIRINRECLTLIDDLMGYRQAGFIYGKSGIGKTFVSLDMALCIATGMPWHGRNVEKSAVVYVALEGAATIGNRIDAWCKYHGKSEADTRGIGVIDGHVNMGKSDADAVEIVKQAQEFGSEIGQRVALVIIDTFSQANPGAKENNSEDTTLVTSAMRKMAEALNATVLAVHHPGKDATRGMRGSGSLFDNSDLVLEVIEGTIRTDKVRDGDDNQRFGFRTERVDLGLNTKGRPLNSLVALPVSNAAPRVEPLKRGSLAEVAFKILAKLADQAAPVFGDGTVDEMAWREACKRDKLSTGTAAAERQAYGRARQDLLSRRYIAISEGNVEIIAPASMRDKTLQMSRGQGASSHSSIWKMSV